VSADSVLIAGVGIVLLLPLGWRVVAGRFDPFEPIVIFGLAWGVMFVVRPVAILIRDDTDFYGVDISPTLGRALLLALIGAIAFVVGYELSFGGQLARRLPAPRDAFSPFAAVVGACVVGAVGVLALAAVLLSAGGLQAVETFFGGRSDALNELIDNSTTYLWWASLLVVPAALASFAVAAVDRRPTTIAAAALLVVLALVRTVPVGNRVFLLVLVGGMIVFMYLRRGKRPGPVALLIAPALALFLSAAVLDFRYAETRGSFSSVVDTLVHTPSRAISPLIKGPDAEMAPALAGALQAVPDRLPYRFGGATIGDLVRRPIPRQLWKDKPETPGHELVALVWPEARERGRFDPTLTPLLYFYWDFGLLGVFVGMGLYGVVARASYEYLRAYARSVAPQVVFAAALWYLVPAVRQDPVSVVIEGVILFVPLVAIFAVAAVAHHGERGVDA
jgi:hypothetical protein